MPPNQIEVKLKFARRRSAKVMGSLADRESAPAEGEKLHGILVTHNFHSKIVAPEDLSTYTPIRVATIKSKLHVPFAGSLETLKLFLNEMFAGVIEEPKQADDGTVGATFSLHGGKVRSISMSVLCLHLISSRFSDSTPTLQVSVTTGKSNGVAIVEWEASPAGDVIADSVVALLMHAQSSASSIRLTSKPCRHPRDPGLGEMESSKKQKAGESDIVRDRLRYMHALLSEQFQTVESVYESNKGSFEIITDSGLESGVLNEEGKLTCSVTVEFDDASGSNAKVIVECLDSKLAKNIQEMLRNAVAAASVVQTS